MSGHTPGSFLPIKGLDPDDDMRCAVVAVRGDKQYLVATIENGAPGDWCDTEWFNAVLFAAAPELLAVLQETVAQYGKSGGPWNVPSDPGGWLDRARAAIAKATGQ